MATSPSLSSDSYFGGQLKTNPWPVLRRIQILFLSVEAREALFPDVENKAHADQKEQYDDLPEPEPIIRYLSNELQHATDRSFPVRQFQSFIVGRKVYVVVDMESVSRGRTLRGLLTFSTTIITEGLPLEKLTTLHVCLVRSFSHNDVPSPSNDQSTAFVSSLSQSFSNQDVPSDPRSVGESSGRSFRRLLSRKPRIGRPRRNSTAPCKSYPPPTHGPVVVNLASVLESYLHRYPCLVFSPGQQILLPLLPEIKELHSFQSEAQTPSSCDGLLFFVYSTSSTIPGVIVPEHTTVSIELDPIGEFERLGVSPLIDTIPQAYEFDFFNDYIKPFVESNPFRLLYEGSLFSYHGVQFKVRHTKPRKKEEIGTPDAGEIYWKSFHGLIGKLTIPPQSVFVPITDLNRPQIEKDWAEDNHRLVNRTIVRRGYVCRRIGRTTRIHLGDPVPPQLRDILPPNVMDEVLRLPTRLQSIAAIHALADLSPQDLIRIFGLSLPDEEGSTSERQLRQEVAAKVLGEFAATYKKDHQGNTAEEGVCVVCLSSVDLGDQILELPCGHIYHLSCVQQWLKRSLVCPVCKRDLRSFLPGVETPSDTSQSWWL